jgi:hypothetical protein
MAKPSKMAKKS